MIFNGIEKSYITVAKGRVLPFFAPLNRTFNHFDSRLLSTDRGTRIVSVPVYIAHEGYTSFQRLKEDIASWLVHEEPKTLEFKDDPGRFYWAVVDGEIESVIDYQYGAEAVINFACGYKYSDEKNLIIDDTLTSDINGNKSTPWKAKVVFNSNQTSYEIQFNSPGKTNLRDINKIRLNYDFKSGDQLVIDYRSRSASLNGNDITNTVSILQSNFMEIPVGANVEFQANHQTTLTYSERYY